MPVVWGKCWLAVGHVGHAGVIVIWLPSGMVSVGCTGESFHGCSSLQLGDHCCTGSTWDGWDLNAKNHTDVKGCSSDHGRVITALFP